MDTYSALNLTLTDGVATVTLDRPEARNALNTVMTDELTALFSELQRDTEVRAVVLGGAGGAFCAGGDVRESRGMPARTHEQRRSSMQRYRALVNSMAGLDRPVIAAVDGVAFGAGFSLALLTDIVLASTQARFCMAFHRIGLVPDCGAWYTLPRVVGVQRAKELVFSARELSADEARALGIVMEVLPAADLMPRAQTLARSFVTASSLALSLSKQALQSSMQSDLGAMLDLEAVGQALAGGSEYASEARRRFAAKESQLFTWPD